jgi:ABC-type phosphate transport system substrate-binding protein
LRCFATVVLALFVGVTMAGESPAAGDMAFQVIVHQDVQGTQIPRPILSSIFLKEALRWGDGHRVEPVDQSLRSRVRQEFSKVVLHESIDGIQMLWNRKVVKGVMPPIVKSTDEEVLAFVAQTKGAIGYVSLGVSLPSTVKVLEIVE